MPFDAAIDIWSIGVILCEAWLGKPFLNEEKPALLILQMMRILGPLPKNALAKGKMFYAHYGESTSIRVEGADQFNMDDPQEYVSTLIPGLENAY